MFLSSVGNILRSVTTCTELIRTQKQPYLILKSGLGFVLETFDFRDFVVSSALEGDF